MASNRDDRQAEERRRMYRMSGMGLEFAAGMIGMTALGVALHKLAGMPQWVVIACAVVGILGGGYNFLRQATRLNREETERYRRSQAGREPTRETPDRIPGRPGRRPSDDQ